ncbi:MAG: hypothetical protein ABSB29_00315 [Nitrososphaerales archaeon]
MRALTRLDHEKLVESVVVTLTKLGYTYARNQGRYVTEFEVRSPSHFGVVVEDLTRTQFGYPLRGRVRVESAVELRRTIGAADDEEELRRHVATFAEELRAALPDEPWKGVGLARSGSERANWESLGEI